MICLQGQIKDIRMICFKTLFLLKLKDFAFDTANKSLLFLFDKNKYLINFHKVL